MEPCWYQVEHGENVRRNSETFRRMPSQASDPTPSPNETSKPALLWLQLQRPVVLRIRWVWAQDLQACAHSCAQSCAPYDHDMCNPSRFYMEAHCAQPMAYDMLAEVHGPIMRFACKTDLMTWITCRRQPAARAPKGLSQQSGTLPSTCL